MPKQNSPTDSPKISCNYRFQTTLLHINKQCMDFLWHNKAVCHNTTKSLNLMINFYKVASAYKHKNELIERFALQKN